MKYAMYRSNWELTFYTANDLLPGTGGHAWVNGPAARAADALGQEFFRQTGIIVEANAIFPKDVYYGKAFDFQIKPLTREQKTLFLHIALTIGFTGIGFYEEGSGHLHLDTGSARTWGLEPEWAREEMKANWSLNHQPLAPLIVTPEDQQAALPETL